jgi:L-asparaginase II
MSEEQVDPERPCLHCMMVELIEDYFAEYPAAPGRSDKVDTDEADEVIDAIAKTFAELTSGQEGAIRQQLVEQLMREIMTTMPSFVEKTRQDQSRLMRGTSGRKD